MHLTSILSGKIYHINLHTFFSCFSLNAVCITCMWVWDTKEFSSITCFQTHAYEMVLLEYVGCLKLPLELKLYF